MSKTAYDIVVVGGGPAGASAARAAVQGGLDTLLIEMHKMPRPKPCSGFLFEEALRFLSEQYGPLPDEVMATPNTVKGARLRLPGDVLLDVPIEGKNIWRDRFDSWLCAESGAPIQDGTRLLDFAEWRDRVELLCRRNGKVVKVTARVLVAADGACSRITRKIDPGFLDGVPLIVGSQRYFRTEIALEPGYLHVFISPDYGIYPAAYLKDDLIVVDTSVKPGAKIPPARDAFLAMLERKHGFRPAEPVLNLGCRGAFPAALNRFCTGTDRVLVTGEAAGFVNAMGEGISTALATGRLAGMAAAQSGASAPGRAYRESTRPERERTTKEWMLPAVMTGRARPELKDALVKQRPLTALKVTRGILAWQRIGGVVPGLQKYAIEVMVRRLLNGDFDFRS
jgi:flavin-dependent dehydrogenase